MGFLVLVALTAFWLFLVVRVKSMKCKVTLARPLCSRGSLRLVKKKVARRTARPKPMSAANNDVLTAG